MQSTNSDSPPSASCVVIGGGPAGLFAAVSVAERLAQADSSDTSKSVTVLEKGPRPGRKLLASGSGQCNITHEGSPEDFLEHYGSRGRFLKPALFSLSPAGLLSWFRERGVHFAIETNGKVFPASRRATEILDVLLARAKDQGVDILMNCPVTRIDRDGPEFIVNVTGLNPDGAQSLVAQTVILATGGRSYPRTGSEGDGYALAATLGHTIVLPRPALTPVKVRNHVLGRLAGLSFPSARFAIRRNGRKLLEARGDLLITHEGLSGPGILDASRGMEPGDILELEFGGKSEEAFRADLLAELANTPVTLVRTALVALGLPRRMAESFIELAGLQPGATCANLRRESREALVRLAAAFPLEIESLGGWDEAMATTGGVDTSEVFPKTMESRLVPGLYFAGEILDIDGDTGGYNLQAAFSTAALAGASAATRAGIRT